MVLADALECLALDAADPVAARLHRSLVERAPAIPGDWQVLAAAVARRLMPAAGVVSADRAWPVWGQSDPPLVVGLAGGQGAGKSTLARALQCALSMAGARAVAVSLDDFYLPRRQRHALARSVHPLLATRGVPGTHDTSLLEHVIAALGQAGRVVLPVFDKGQDDVLPAGRWNAIAAPVDVLVLEGWCVGARAQPETELDAPVNELEAESDPDGIWRRYVNAALAGPYARLWDRLDVLIYLDVPDLDAVIRWRSEQEASLPAARRMDLPALERFVAHYERITRAMQRDLPGRASLVVRLDGHHRVAGLRPGTAG